VGDRLLTGKPPRRRHPGLLSLSQPSMVRVERVPRRKLGQ